MITYVASKKNVSLSFSDISLSIMLSKSICVAANSKTPFFLWLSSIPFWVSKVAIAVKHLPANAGDIRDTSSVPGLVRSSGGEHGHPFQYSCLENPMNWGARWATVRSISKRLKQFSTHAQYSINIHAHTTYSLSINLVRDTSFASISWQL